VFAICASFQASSLIGNSDGLITMAHIRPYLFFLLSNCTYNIYIIKNEDLLVCFMRILNSCVDYKFQPVNPGCPPSLPHTY